VSYTSRSFFWLDNPTDFVIQPFRQVISSFFLIVVQLSQDFVGVGVPEDEIRFIVIELPLLQYPKKLNK